jgi:hypothetical protein
MPSTYLIKLRDEANGQATGPCGAPSAEHISKYAIELAAVPILPVQV